MSSFSTHTQELEELKKLGFTVNPLNVYEVDINNIWAIRDDLANRRDTLNYPIDGVVVKLDDNILKESLGNVGKTPRGWCAVKFNPTEVVTKVLNIIWQVGRTGKLTPVAELEAVELQGSIVRRATMHNYREVVESGIQIGSLVVIRKAGDIIPEIIKVIE
jgi:DNA ligase (NAD+)